MFSSMLIIFLAFYSLCGSQAGPSFPSFFLHRVVLPRSRRRRAAAAGHTKPPRRREKEEEEGRGGGRGLTDNGSSIHTVEAVVRAVRLLGWAA